MRIQLKAVMLTGLVLLAGCRPTPGPTPVPSGRVRVASLAPSVTEIVCAIGAADLLVGRTTACDYPPDVVAKVPVIGGFGAPSLERLLAIRPDIVLYPDLADASIGPKLDRAGLRHARIACTRLNDIPAAIRTVGGHLHREKPANLLADELTRQIGAARASAATGQCPRVLVLIWNDPLTAAGRNSFLSEVVALAGGRNVGDDIARDYFQVSGEWVLTRNPDVVLCFFMANGGSVRQSVMQLPGWTRVKAVETGRVYDGFDNNLILRPGPRVMEGVRAIRACLARDGS